MKIKDLFDYKYGVNLELINCQETNKTDENSVNFVARTSVNNGVTARVRIIEGIIPQKAGTLSLAVSGSVLSCFVQIEDYYSGRDLYVLTPKIDLTLEQKLFYAMCINKNAYRYSYGRAANKTFPDIEIPELEECNKLIADSKVKQIKTKNKRKKDINLNSINWKEFKVGDIFTCINGKGLTEKEIEDNPGKIPCIQGGADNCGILGYADINYLQRINSVIISEPCITIARVGTSGQTNFHSKTCSIGDKAKALKLKHEYQLHKNCFVYLFLKTVLQSLKYKYCYGRGIVTDTYLNEIIRLPVKNNQPNWEYMENYIKSLSYADKI